MPRISTDNYDTVASWNGSQDLFIVEQPDGTKVATPAMVKQFIEAGDFEATGEVIDGHGNMLKDMAKSAEIGDLSQTGLTGDSVAEQLDTAREQISQLNSNLIPREISLTSPMGTVEGKAYVTGGILLVNAYVTLTSAITNNNGHILTLGESVIKGNPNWVGANFIDAGIIRGYGVGNKIYCQTNVASGKVLSVALAFPIN